MDAANYFLSLPASHKISDLVANGYSFALSTSFLTLQALEATYEGWFEMELLSHFDFLTKVALFINGSEAYIYLQNVPIGEYALKVGEQIESFIQQDAAIKRDRSQLNLELPTLAQLNVGMLDRLNT